MFGHYKRMLRNSLPNLFAFSGQRLARRALAVQAGVLFVVAATLAASSAPTLAGDAPEAAPATERSMQDYALGPRDKIKIRAYEWRPAQDDVFEWKTLNTEYVIGASGNLALPLIGEIKAAGLTTPAMADAIASQLRRRLGLSQTPDVSVEIVSYRPFYVLGYVQKPGEYEYRPGLTLLQAVSIAGGFQQTNDMNSKRLQHDLISAQGDLSVLNGEFNSLVARKARLQADFFNLDQIEFPPVLTSNGVDPDVQSLMQQERVYFETRKQAMDSQLSAFQNLKQFLLQEKASLESQLKIHNKRMQLTQQELNTITDLLKKGLATAPHKLDLERNVAELDSERIKLELDIMRSNEEVSKVDLSIADLHTHRIAEITSDMLQTDTRLQEIKHRSATTVQLLQETSTEAVQLLDVSDELPGRSAKFTIVRNVNGVIEEMAASEASELMPGDTIKITFAGSAANSATYQEASTPAEGIAPPVKAPTAGVGQFAQKLDAGMTGAPVTH